MKKSFLFLTVLNLFLLQKSFSQTSLGFQKQNWVFGGLDYGSSDVEVTSGSTVVEESGTYMNLKGLYSLKMNNMLFLEGGLGYMVHDNNFAKSSLLNLEFSPKFSFLKDKLLIGPHLNYFPLDDLAVTNTSTGKTNMTFGLGAFYALPIKNMSARIGVQYSKGFDLPEGISMNAIMLSIQFGFQLNKSKTSQEPVSKPNQKVEQLDDIDDLLAEDIEKENPIADGLFMFPSGKYELNQRTKDYIAILGKFLGKNQKYWVKLRIKGMTDIHEDPQNKMKLDLRRAREVVRAFRAAGIDKKRLSYIRFNKKVINNVVDNPSFRRVEMNIVEKADVPKFRDIIIKLEDHFVNKVYEKPKEELGLDVDDVSDVVEIEE